MIDRITTPEQRREMSAALKADLLLAYDEAEDGAEKNATAVLIGLLEEDDSPAAEELESDVYHDHTYEPPEQAA